MAIKYDLICKTGTYKDKNGDEKNRWSKIGVVMDTRQGSLAGKIENIPVGWDGWFSMAEPKPKDNFTPRGSDEMPKPSVDNLDDVPF